MSVFHFAVIGGGSIGTRHARNLISLGQKVRIIETHLPQVATLREFEVHTDLDAAFAPEVDAVLICSPTIRHLMIASSVIPCRYIPITRSTALMFARCHTNTSTLSGRYPTNHWRKLP